MPDPLNPGGVPISSYVDSNGRAWTLTQTSGIATASGDYDAPDAVLVGNSMLLLPALIEAYAADHRTTPPRPPVRVGAGGAIAIGLVVAGAIALLVKAATSR